MYKEEAEKYLLEEARKVGEDLSDCSDLLRFVNLFNLRDGVLILFRESECLEKLGYVADVRVNVKRIERSGLGRRREKVSVVVHSFSKGVRLSD